MSFTPYSKGTGDDAGELYSVIIANSITINEGEAVKFDTNGFCTNGTAGAAIFGICIGFTQANGAPLIPASYVAGTATGTDVTQVVAASNNQTVNMYKAIIETSKLKKWSAQVNGTINTTVGSSQPGFRVDVDSANTNYGRVLETTATRTDGTIANFFGWGLDPNDSTRFIVSIAASQKETKQG